MNNKWFDDEFDAMEKSWPSPQNQASKRSWEDDRAAGLAAAEAAKSQAGKDAASFQAAHAKRWDVYAQQQNIQANQQMMAQQAARSREQNAKAVQEMIDRSQRQMREADAQRQAAMEEQIRQFKQMAAQSAAYAAKHNGKRSWEDDKAAGLAAADAAKAQGQKAAAAFNGKRDEQGTAVIATAAPAPALSPAPSMEEGALAPHGQHADWQQDVASAQSLASSYRAYGAEQSSSYASYGASVAASAQDHASAVAASANNLAATAGNDGQATASAAAESAQSLASSYRSEYAATSTGNGGSVGTTGSAAGPTGNSLVQVNGGGDGGLAGRTKAVGAAMGVLAVAFAGL